MSVTLAFAAAVLFGVGTYLVLQRKLSRIIIGLGLIGHGTNLLFVISGSSGDPPLLGSGDPERFPEPDRLDVARPDNRHLAFGWAAHFCFGAPLARLEGQIVLSTLLRRLTDLRLEPQPLVWRTNLGLRGLTALPVAFRPSPGGTPTA